MLRLIIMGKLIYLYKNRKKNFTSLLSECVCLLMRKIYKIKWTILMIIEVLSKTVLMTKLYLSDTRSII